MPPNIGGVNQASVQGFIKEAISKEQIKLFALPDGVYDTKIPRVSIPELEGLQYRIDFHTGTNFGGGGARGPLQLLPEGTGNNYQKGYITDKTWYYALNGDGLWFRRLKNASNPTMYMNDLENLIEGTMEGYAAMMEWFHWGMGDGTMAQVSSISGTSVVIDSNIRHFYPGMYLEFWGGVGQLTHRIGGTNASLPARFKVETVDGDTNTIGLDAAPTSLTAGDLVTRYGNTYVDGGVKISNEPFGIPYFLRNNATIMGVDLTLPANVLLRPYIKTATYTSDMEPLGWKRLLDGYTVLQSRQKAEIKEIWAGDTTITKFLEWQKANTKDLGLLILGKESVGTDASFHIIHKGRKIPFFESTLMPLDQWWLMPKADARGEAIGMCYPWEIEWCTEGEGKNHLHAFGPDYDAYWGWFSTCGQMIAKAFYKLGKITWS